MWHARFLLGLGLLVAHFAFGAVAAETSGMVPSPADSSRVQLPPKKLAQQAPPDRVDVIEKLKRMCDSLHTLIDKAKASRVELEGLAQKRPSADLVALLRENAAQEAELADRVAEIGELLRALEPGKTVECR